MYPTVIKYIKHVVCLVFTTPVFLFRFILAILMQSFCFMALPFMLVFMSHRWACKNEEWELDGNCFKEMFKAIWYNWLVEGKSLE